ncbi:MAG: ATPase [Bacteroidetes bacterium]|nr:ATPase [Bacteroidota bacterium]
MSVLIADSGSTKTDWVLLDQGRVVMQSSTIGFNPYFQTSDAITGELNARLIPALGAHVSQITDVRYYGAGCSNEVNVASVRKGIQAALPKASIEVNHDLLAAARALCGKEPGIACILGTGSNSCLYDGATIRENVISVGYLFGDHGSGACMGKSFIQDYFDGKLPLHLQTAFEQAGYNREEILDNVYKKSMPSRYLAQVSTFLSAHVSDTYVRAIIKRCFVAFFDHQVSKYTNSRNLPVNCVGSVGFYYKDILLEAAREKGFTIGTVIKSPIEGLIRYYQ